MSIIEFEIDEIRKLCENVVPNSKIIACTASPSPLVRVDIHENQVQRQLTVCLRFPTENYPKQPIFVELKSRTLSQKFLDGLTALCEKQAREQLGKPQGLHVLRFIQSYLHDNPLCVCYDEIQQLRRELGDDATPDQLKLKQRSSTVVFIAKGGDYFAQLHAVIPEEYAQKCVELRLSATNLPGVLHRYLIGQAREIARQCAEAPLRASKDALASFQPAPSLYKALKFFLEATRDFHIELCAVCEKPVLPTNSADIVRDDSQDAFVERAYCGHFFHQVCLRKYIDQPPFPTGGKLCPAKQRHPRSDARYYLGVNVCSGTGNKKPTKQNTSSNGTCGVRLAHDRWVVNVQMASARWAQRQARERELQEVVDFLK